MGNGSPQYRWRLNSQSRSRKLTVPSPRPRCSSQALTRALAAGTSRPSRDSSPAAELMMRASFALNESSQAAGSVPRPSVGSTTQTIGSSKARANAKSRLSCAGTAMIAPVP